MGFWAGASAVNERARTDFGRPGQHLYDYADGEIVVVAAELALAEAEGKGRKVSGRSGLTSSFEFERMLRGEGTYPGATQFTMTPLDVMGDRRAICFTTKTASSFETL